MNEPHPESWMLDIAARDLSCLNVVEHQIAEILFGIPGDIALLEKNYPDFTRDFRRALYPKREKARQDYNTLHKSTGH